MPIQTVGISDTQGGLIIQTEETHFADVKAIEIRPGKLTESISALSNASGGELYIGVDEKVVDGEKKRSWRGFKDTEAANAHLQVFEKLFPLGQYYTYTFLKSGIGPGLVLQVNINKTREISRASDGGVYLRRGAQNLASPEEAVMEYLEGHDEIVNRVGREITGISSENSMKNVFYRLRDRKLIEPVPGRVGFGSAWRRARSTKK